MTGTLKARVSGAWVPILGSGQEAASTARWNSAWGVIGRAFGTTNQTGITATTALTGVTVTATLVVGRRYRVSLSSGPGISDTASTQVIGVRRDGTFIGQRSMSVPSGNVEQVGEVVAVFDETAGGSHVFDAAISRNLGVGTVGNYAGASNPTVLTVEDVGPVTPASIAPPTAGPRVVASGNALGIVAMGSLNTAVSSLPGNTNTQVTNNLSATFLTGRRYRVSFELRAMTITGSTPIAVNAQLRDGTTSIPDSSGPWNTAQQVVGYYTSFTYDWIFDGDGTTKSLNVIMNPTGAVAVSIYPQNQGYFYVEDVGPNTSPALPIPATPPAWTPATLGNGWTNYLNGYQTASYRKIGDMVHLRGTVNGGATGQIFVLPVGFCPPANLQLIVRGSDGAKDVPAFLDINTAGSVASPLSGIALLSMNFQFSTTA